MKRRFSNGLMVASALLGFARASHGQVVGVTLRFDTNQIVVGASTLLHVQAQILPPFRSTTEQIFSWYVDVENTNGAAATANYAVMLKPASDKDPLTSSFGTADGTNRRGIYDTFSNLLDAGRDTPVELMTISVQGTAPGQTRFRARAGTTAPGSLSDFLVATTGYDDSLVGGDYSAAAADLTVLPNPLVAPRLTITRATLPNGTSQVTIHYAVQAGFDYYVEYRDSQATGVPWLTLPGGPHNSGAPTDIPGVATRYYRVRVAPVAPRLTITRATLSNGTSQVTIHYTLQAGFNHYVEYRDSLATGVPWLTLPDGPHNSGVLTDIPGVRTRFYRVRAAAL